MTIPAGEVAELLTALIRNACVNDGTPDSGQEVRSTDTLDAYLGVSGDRFEPHPGRVSAVYRVPGSDADAPSLMLMGHTDVVPVSPEGWTVDPFAGEVADGFVWGRGAVDMLNQTSAMAAVFKRHLEGEASYRGDLIFLAVADEEAGAKLGAKWLVEEHWDAVACAYQLTEIGTPLLSGRSGVGLPVTVAEKGPQWRRVSSQGVPGHGSQPYGSSNALIPLADAVARLGQSPPGPLVTDEWRRFVEAWGPAPDLAEKLVDPEAVGEAIDLIALEDIGLARWIHACTHLTVSPNMLDAGVKANVIADAAVAEVDVRSLPGQDQQDVDDHFRKVIGPGIDELEVEVLEATRANGSPPEGPLWDALGAGLAATGSSAHLIPAMIPVGTDARFFRPKGTVSYGVSLFDDRVGFGEFLTMFHGHDERVSVESLGLTANLYVNTIRELDARV